MIRLVRLLPVLIALALAGAPFGMERMMDRQMHAMTAHGDHQQHGGASAHDAQMSGGVCPALANLPAAYALPFRPPVARMAVGERPSTRLASLSPRPAYPPPRLRSV